EDGSCYFVKVSQDIKKAHNFCAILEDESVQKIFHFARFDVAILQHTYCVKISNIYCTKIASKLTRTYTEKHGLKELCKELLSVDLSKEQQSSYWGADSFSKEQLKYAANDVLYLHALKARLNILLEREKRLDLAHECFRAIPVISTLDSLGFNDLSVLEH
ncbi:MAG: ribonuclease D, partial [Bacteroidota bacterium]